MRTNLRSQAEDSEIPLNPFLEEAFQESAEWLEMQPVELMGAAMEVDCEHRK